MHLENYITQVYNNRWWNIVLNNESLLYITWKIKTTSTLVCYLFGYRIGIFAVDPCDLTPKHKTHPRDTALATASIGFHHLRTSLSHVCDDAMM